MENAEASIPEPLMDETAPVKLRYKERTRQIRIDTNLLTLLEQLKGYKESYSDVIRRVVVTAKMDTLHHDLTSKKQEELEDEIEETKALRENIAEIEGESE